MKEEPVQTTVDPLTAREEAARKIRALEKERAQVLQSLKSEVASAEVEFRESQAQVLRIKVKYERVRGTLAGAEYRFNEAIGKQRAFLQDTCDPAIDRELDFFGVVLQELRAPGLIYTVPVETISEAITHVQKALATLEEMRYEVVFDDERVQALKEPLAKIIGQLDERARSRLRSIPG